MTSSPSATGTGAGEIAASTTCGSSASTQSTSSGVITSTHVESSCVVVLSDGRRYRCSSRWAQRLGPGVTPPSVFEHAKQCRPLSRLVIPRVLRAVAARIAKARACLTERGLRVLGGLVFPPQPHGESYAPDGELDSSDLLVAFYTDARSAETAAPYVMRNVKRFRGEFDRSGANNIVWIAAPPHRLVDIVDGCVGG